jgi:glycerate kinase
MTAREAADAIEAGVLKALPDCSTVKIPMADGGEGTVEAMVDATKGHYVEEEVTGPLGNKVKARYGILGDGRTAVIEMASASGLPLVPPKMRNPMKTTTYGTGELIRSALGKGAERIIIGIGGSATVDGGVGMAQAIGVRFLDEAGQTVGPGGESLAGIRRIDLSTRLPEVGKTEFRVACDVDNPLTGPKGAARVYGPQKGATPEIVERLEANLANLAKVIEKELALKVNDLPGAGAAGGLGAGLVAFAGATLEPGIDIVIETLRLMEKLKEADLVITGEGQMDYQSVFGKTPIGVAHVAKELGIPVIAVVGSLGERVEEVLTAGIDAYFSSIRTIGSEEDILRAGPKSLTETTANVLRALLLGRKTERSG